MVRVISGVVLGMVALAAIALLPAGALRFAALAVALLAAREFLGIARRTGLTPTAVSTYAFVAVACWCSSVPEPRGELLVAAGLALLLIEVVLRGRSLSAASTALTGGIYLGVPLGALVAVHALGGREAVLLLIGTIVASDTSQYYTGRLFGRRRLAPAISPKKTVEGAVGGVAFGTAVMVVAGGLVFPSARRSTLVSMGFAVVLLGICGDLFESRLKRAAGVKDSSTLIPGHGGVLDRIDALLFATPAFYLFLQQLT